MKLSSFMEKQFKLMDDELLLEAADKKLDKESSSEIIIVGENTIMSKIKRITTAAACFLLAVAAVGAFFVIQSSIETVPNDSTADKASTNDIVEDYNYQVPISYETREEYGYIERRSETVWNDFVFYVSNNDLLYANIKHGPFVGTSVFEGTEKNKEFLPDPKTDTLYIMVDQYASERNDGYPVLIIGYDNNNDFSERTGGTVISYDMKTKTVNLLATNIGKYICNIGIYGEYVFATGASSNTDYSVNNLYRIALDGSETIMLDNPDGSYNVLYRVDENYVFYHHDPETIYRTTHDFNEETEVCKSPIGAFKFDGKYLYTYDYIYKNVDGEIFCTYDLIKMDFNNPSEREILVDDYSALSHYNNGVYYLKFDPTYYGGKLCKSNNVIYSYNFSTGKETVIADLSDIDKNIIIRGACEQSLLLRMIGYTDGVMTDMEGYHYDIESGKLTQVFTYDINEYGEWVAE